MTTYRSHSSTRLLAVVAMLTGVACGEATRPQEAPVAITFAARVGDADFMCGERYLLGNPPTQTSLADLRFYIHDVRLIRADGNDVRVTLADNDFQFDDVALLDFEDGLGGCSGDTAFNNVIEGTVPVDDYTGIEFRLGVPLDRNFADDPNPPSPFNRRDMEWAWKEGYKVLRIESVSEEEAPGIRVHLGAIADSENHPEIVLHGFDPYRSEVTLDVADLFAATDVSTNAADTPVGCMSSSDDIDCAPIFEALGLSFDGSAPRDQSVFSLR